MLVIKEFKNFSGLDMNSNKSELFFGGYLDIEKIMFSDLFGIKLVSFQQGIWVCF